MGMVMSTSLLFMMVVAVPSGLEKLSCGKIIAAVLLTVGGCLQGLSTWRHREDPGAGSKSLQGYLMAFSSLIIASIRWSILQHILQRSKAESFLKRMPKLKMLSCIMPVTGCVCFILAAIFERSAFDRINADVLQD